MTTALLSVLALAVLFTGFALMNRGSDGRRGCSVCDEDCSDDGANCNTIRESR